MKGWKGILVGILLASILHIYIFGWSAWTGAITAKWIEVRSDLFHDSSSSIELDRGLPELTFQEVNESNESVTDQEELHLDGETTTQGLYLGMTEEELVDLLGEPQRREKSAYGYDWWIYNQNWMSYIQVGMKENKVVTAYTNAPNWSWGALAPGTAEDSWKEQWEAKSSVVFNYKLGYYTFELTPADMEERPLMIDGDIAIQLYIDIHNNHRISGIRLMDLETLLLHRPYALKYVGQLPESPTLSEEEWKDIEKANEEQIFDIVNNTRILYELAPFQWHGEAADVARGHSLDMGTNDYFDHVSPVYGDLGNRLQKADVIYQTAGENIAWNYVDGPDAHEGWLNSLGHRKNIMQEQFTHLGVGVIQKHYTQNFLRP